MDNTDGLKVLPPEPVSDERTPLLRGSQDRDVSPEDALEAQAEQERREHDVAATPIADEPSTAKLILIMSSLWVTTFFAAMDTTIVATLAKPITSDFNSSKLFSWIASGYVIANAACQPLSGKLTDIYGRRAGLVFASTFFAAGTLICGLATEGWVIIAGRVIAGMGGGCLNTISTFIGSDLVPLRKRGLLQGIGNIVYGSGMALGGVVGGAISDRYNWRFAFYIQVPFIVVGGLIAITTIKIPIKETEENKLSRVDFAGATTLLVSFLLLLLGLNSGGNIVPWDHPLVLTSLPLSVVILIAFVIIEDRFAHEPVIPVRLLLIRTVGAACLMNWFVTMAAFSLIYYIPIYFQVVRGTTATGAGLLFIPQSIGTAIGSLGTGMIMRLSGNYTLWNFVVQVMSLIACSLILGTFKSNVDNIPPFIYLAMNGLAYGSMLTIGLIAMIASVDHKHQAVITSASYAFRSTGSAIGIAVSGAVFQNILKHKLFERLGDLPGAADTIRQIRNDVDTVKHLSPEWQKGALDSYVDALRGVWAVVLGFAILTAIASFFIKQQKLHSNLARK